MLLCLKVGYSSLLVNIVPFYECFIHSALDGHLDYIQLLAIMKKFLDHVYFLTLQKAAKCVCKAIAHFTVPSETFESTGCSAALTHFHDISPSF